MILVGSPKTKNQQCGDIYPIVYVQNIHHSTSASIDWDDCFGIEILDSILMIGL